MKYNEIISVVEKAVEEFTMAEQTANAITDFLGDCKEEVENAENADELQEIFEEWNTRQEVIYYYNAWQVIKAFVESHNDYDFSEIKGMLSEYGYETIESIGSELLATIITQSENANAFGELLALLED